jgi:hypothetical protein
MTDSMALVIVAAIAAIPPTLATLVTARINFKKQDHVAKIAIDAAAGKDAVSSKQLDTIHALVNSRLQEEIMARKIAEDRVNELEAMLLKT